jgi:hypothetical protein
MIGSFEVMPPPNQQGNQTQPPPIPAPNPNPSITNPNPPTHYQPFYRLAFACYLHHYYCCSMEIKA